MMPCATCQATALTCFSIFFLISAAWAWICSTSSSQERGLNHSRCPPFFLLHFAGAKFGLRLGITTCAASPQKTIKPTTAAIPRVPGHYKTHDLPHEKYKLPQLTQGKPSKAANERQKKLMERATALIKPAADEAAGEKVTPPPPPHKNRDEPLTSSPEEKESGREAAIGTTPEVSGNPEATKKNKSGAQDDQDAGK